MQTYNVQKLVSLGMDVCLMIKNFYFKDQKWTPKISNEIHKMFAIVKEKAKTFHKDLNEEKLLEMIIIYSIEDFNDCLENYFNMKDKVHE
jgi:hypothetical protein